MKNINKYQDWTESWNLNREGSPFKMTLGQSEIFKYIYEQQYKRVAIKAVTQYGKSDVASLAIVHLSVDNREKILIVSPSLKQSSIIMGYVIDHFFDHPDLQSQLEVNESLERLRRERSKKRLTIKTGSEIAILTADARTISQQAKGLMGFGATVVIVDESALIPDEMYAKILRMVGGTAGRLIQLGNPFPSQHFQKAFKSDRYHKITIDWRQALKEGRITQDFLDEAREDMPAMDFEIFYECKFPEGGGEDSVIPAQIALECVSKDIAGGEVQWGLDVARFGRDKTVLYKRSGGMVTECRVTEKQDTMAVVGWVQGFVKKDELGLIDVVGIGSGVYDRLDELGYNVKEINVGESPTTDEAKRKFFNLRAEMWWDMRNRFIKKEISIPDDKELFEELTEIRYKYSSERKIRIESKDEMKKRIGRSPDKADALGLAFFSPSEVRPEFVVM